MLTLLSWTAVTLGCNGAPELAVTYLVPFVTVFMALAPWCPPDEFGQPQACLTIAAGEWAVGTATSIEPPNPPLEQAYVFGERLVVVDAAENRSDQPGGCEVSP